jgi:hypothetical protein
MLRFCQRTDERVDSVLADIRASTEQVTTLKKLLGAAAVPELRHSLAHREAVERAFVRLLSRAQSERQ